MLTDVIVVYLAVAVTTAIVDCALNGSEWLDAALFGLVAPAGAVPVIAAIGILVLYERWQRGVVRVAVVLAAGFAIGGHCMPEPPPAAWRSR